MRIDDAGPRTWLLASVAGWALLGWLLAVAGMGGRVEPLPADPGLLPPLPVARPAPPLRLGPVSQYGEIAARPLFSDDRRPKPFFLQGDSEEAETKVFDYVLTSVLITPGMSMAILQPPDGSESLRVKLGEAPEAQPDWRMVTINPRSAVFEGPQGRKTLQLRVFDGVGGEPPTAVSAPGRTSTTTSAMPESGSATDADDPGMVEAMPVPTPAPARQTPRSPPVATPERTPEAAPMTDQAQMDAIRERIQQRRAKLRGETPSKPPAQIQ